MQLAIRSILLQLDLTENEIRVYLELLKRKDVVAANLAREIQLDKSSVYRALESLVSQGYVLVERKKRGTAYQVGSLQILKDSLQAKMLGLKNSESKIDDVIEEIKKQALSGERDTYIKVEKGFDAHIALMEKSLENKDKMILEKFPIYGPRFSSVEYAKYLDTFIPRRIKKNIHVKTLYNFENNVKYKSFMKTSADLLKELRILPVEIDRGNYLKIWDDYVELMDYDKIEDEYTVITLKDKFVSEMLKTFFEYIWVRSPAFYGEQVLPTRILGEVKVPVMGIGTWGVGGYATKNPYARGVEEVDNLRYALGSGLTYIDTSHFYASQYSLPLIRKAITNFPRDSYFINVKLGYPGTSKKQLIKQCIDHLSALGIEYADTVQIHAPMAIDIPIFEAVEAMDELVDMGMARYISVGNFNVEQLDEAQTVSKHGIASHEIHHNLLIRANEENGVIDYCRKQKILLIAYQPLRRGYLAGIEDETLSSLAKKYDKTQSQIILNWMASKEYMMFLIKASRGSHVNENVAALSWKMSKSDYKILDDWKMTGYSTPEYDKTGKSKDGLKIWKL